MTKWGWPHANTTEDHENIHKIKKKGKRAHKSSKEKHAKLEADKNVETHKLNSNKGDANANETSEYVPKKNEISLNTDGSDIDLTEENTCKERIPDYSPIDECYLHDCME